MKKKVINLYIYIYIYIINIFHENKFKIFLKYFKNKCAVCEKKKKIQKYKNKKLRRCSGHIWYISPSFLFLLVSYRYHFNLILNIIMMFSYSKLQRVFTFKEYIYIYIYMCVCVCVWIPISSTGKVSNCCIRNLGFNPRLHQKLIGVLVW